MGVNCDSMPAVLKSTEYRLKAEEAELMASTVSYGRDRNHFAAEARKWRLLEAEALATEASASLKEPKSNA
jgi:hypothetical protein